MIYITDANHSYVTRLLRPSKQKSLTSEGWFLEVLNLSVSQGTSSTTAPMWTLRSMTGLWSLWLETDWPIRFRVWHWTPPTTLRSRPETPKAWDPCQTQCSSGPLKVKRGAHRSVSPIKINSCSFIHSVRLYFQLNHLTKCQVIKVIKHVSTENGN